MAWEDDSWVGKHLGRHEYTADAGAVQQFIAATRDANPWYTGESPLGGPVVPALFLHSEQYRFPLKSWYLPKLFGNLHIKQEWELFRAMPTGSRLWTHGMILDRYLRRDRDVVVNEFSIFGDDDVLVARGRCHQSFLLDAAVAGSVVDKGAAAKKSVRPVEEAPPLELLAGARKVTDPELCLAFSGPAKNYHNDREEAVKLGFPDVVVQGTLSTTFISELLTQRFGLGWIAGGRMSLNLINVLWGGEAVTPKAAIRDRRPEGPRTRVSLDVWTEKDDGRKTIAGTASALQ
ncbi:MAG: hypothetical protein ACKVVT_19640 [Dehalococcoidia bacterium]